MCPIRPMAARTPDVALPSLLASYLLVSVQTPPPGRRPPSFAPMSLEVAVVLSLNTDGSWFLCAVLRPSACPGQPHAATFARDPGVLHRAPRPCAQRVRFCSRMPMGRKVWPAVGSVVFGLFHLQRTETGDMGKGCRFKS